ncbi:MAG: bifunctional nuclease family protein [Candidatus Hydrothermarchaeales archaeon]
MNGGELTKSDKKESADPENRKDGNELVKVEGVFVANSPEGTSPVVFLENDDKKLLPIYVGAAEAFSIHTAIEKMPYPRPLTHDLLVSVLERLDTKVGKIIIDELNDGIFFARLIVKKNGEEMEFDTRPSDGVALAVRTDAPIYVSRKIMKDASVDRDTYKVE